MKSKLIATITIIAFICSILQINYVYAAERQLFPFEVGGITVDCEGQRTISDKDKPRVLPNKNGGLNELTLYEQSTYQDKLPNHYYYRTVGYIMALLKEPNVKDESIITSSYYDNNTLRLEESRKMRELIKETPGYDFGEPYVTSYTFSRQFFDNLFGKDVVDKADWLLRIGLVEFYKTDSEGNEGPALGSMYAVHEDIFKDVTLAMQT